MGQYDGTVGKVRAALDHAGFTDDTVIVVTSNHGLDFFGHDASVAHGTLYDPVLHIPFVIDDPASPLRGVVNDTMIQGIDLAPTILARSGIPLAATMDGHSLLSLLGYAGAYTATTVYSMTSAMDASLRTPEYKLIVCRADCCGAAKAPADGPCRGAEVYKLFDLVADPEERHDIAAERPAVVAEYADQLRTWHHQQNAITPGGTAFPIDPAQKKMLQERGYWDLMFPNGDTPDTHAPPTAPEHPLPPAR